ncbi:MULTISPECIES: GDSL-type esterase/lipase family protein [Lactiplantibacillus]|uniref:GDSL-type esterase/lipase family protein n=2 Tax=Lactiplantibacillus pentosus TaxID=1589 RepID=A0AAP5PZU7_LACPE|nr:MULTISPECIES: GDSL-type esterase/lipase family protein [Lactiplantibacillus]ASG80226.1 lysophospholipase [Lactiplantibacillus pentosus]AUI77556.1 hypothetical protein BB562_02020 [Lactiplantibacillus pentosus]AYJ43062.1 lysophospholipase [Lactiplantibacillus pentosus]KRK25339.1 GDSL-like lipase acylhydrolase family protein [Lactiplantibacillus pentosus DSM 20314]MBU7461908.1 lysophospholipase [Lactiplantibacillus pentosus]
MINESIQLTNLDPRIVKFQQTILNKYATANQTALKGQIVITGSSTVEIFPIEALQTKLQLKHKIYNRGIRAMTTADELAHMDTLIFELQPSILFLQIGANDMSFNLPEETMMHNYDQIMTLIANKLPNTQVYIMAYYPINTVADFNPTDDPHPNVAQHRTNAMTMAANIKVKALATKHHFDFIDLNAGLTDTAGNLKKTLTFDGLHPLPAGYDIIFNNMLPYLK